jgi:hypothetical protein
MMTNSFYGLTNEESNGLYGQGITYGGTYFQWYVYQVGPTQPTTPTGGSWNFQTNTGTAPTGWLANPPVNPLSNVWVSIAIVSSSNPNSLTWSTPGEFAFSTGASFGTMALQNANAVAITGGTLNGATIGGGSF